MPVGLNMDMETSRDLGEDCRYLSYLGRRSRRPECFEPNSSKRRRILEPEAW